ncbi:MAG: diacylglycerol kinase family protein [Planctomycetota bacterium]
MKSASRIRSFGYAFSGLTYLIRTQPNARIHLGCAFAVIALAAGLRVDSTSWALLVVAISMVWVGESLNTAIELILDLVHPETHPLAKAAKDVAAAGVLLAAVSSTVIGLLVLGPPLWRMLPG